jgi:TonB family protein
VIEVTIGADGRLLQSIVRRSSGHADIDEAAMRILKLAAPYDPFPPELSGKHDEIRIAYEWQFLDGAAQGSSVYYADPDRPGAAPASGAQTAIAQPGNTQIAQPTSAQPTSAQPNSARVPGTQ